MSLRYFAVDNLESHWIYAWKQLLQLLQYIHFLSGGLG